MDSNEKRLNEEMRRLLSMLEIQISNLYSSAINLFQPRQSLSGSNPFWFSQNTDANKQLSKLITSFNKQTNATMLNAIERSWKLGEESFVDKMHLALSKEAQQRKHFDEMRETATQEQRAQGSQSSAERFVKQKRDGRNLSNRVWDMSKNMRGEIETIIQNGMKEGKSADQLTKELQKYLNEPDALFRKVRDKNTGKLELSEAAKKYKPGQGVYRSAYKNAMRLARTEINAAYRRAQWERFQTDPQVIGIRIALSNNHTCINPKTGKPEPFVDICDELAGDYPKSFLWEGWHPQCRCVQFPILVGPEDFRKMLDAEVRGEKYEPKQITKPPKAIDEWIERNRERAKGWSNTPYWIKDNQKFAKNFEVNSYTKQEHTFTHARNAALAMSRAMWELSKLYPNIPNTSLAAIHHYTKTGGNYRQLNKQLEKGTLTDFNAASATLINQGLEKLPKFEGNVYRGMIIKRSEFEKAFAGEKGGVIQHNRFVSTSKDTGIGLNFSKHTPLKKNEISVFMEIKSKTGRDISSISEKNGIFAPENQQEVLFFNNTPFKVEEKKYNGNNVFLKLVEI
jgi:hypothetical protein